MRVVKPLSKKKLQKFQTEQDNTGVLYMARVPPYMKPAAVRKLLEGYGTEVLRVYLAAEDTASRARRLRNGGNKKNNRKV